MKNINTMLSVLKERDDFKNSLISTDVSKSLTAVINTFGEQSLKISELKKDNVVLKLK
ncbi:hypothetical protein [Spiroplasma endosymbiont of Stenodema calcarata]|uniref:hypothetical protein n=1 Tax=Spiroplasma endosymbiont of Stenodema calcarata TaxID=3139328 RepID=UPI003CCA8D72